MKKLKTRNEYVGCNNKCRFYGDTIEATSYGHWCFVKRINGKVVFNNYTYSKTTSKHQWEIRYLLKELGIKIDHEVNFRQSLSEWSFKEEALHNYYHHAVSMIVKNHTKGTRKKTIEENKESLIRIRRTIRELQKSGATYSTKRLLRLYRNYKKGRDLKQDAIEFFRKNKGVIFRDRKEPSYKLQLVKRDNTVIIAKKLNGNSTVRISPSTIKSDFVQCKLTHVLNKVS